MKYLVYVVVITVLLLVGCLFANLSAAAGSEGLMSCYAMISFAALCTSLVMLVCLLASILKAIESK